VLRSEDLSQLQAKIEKRWRYPRLRKDGDGTMKKKLSILTAAIAILGMSLYPANASLLGMPLNLKAALELHDTATPAYPFHADDVFAGPMFLVSRFRSSYAFAAPLLRTSESKDTSKPIDLVWLWIKSPHDERAAIWMRTSEPPH
jgi:hypothetical protein